MVCECRGMCSVSVFTRRINSVNGSCEQRKGLKFTKVNLQILLSLDSGVLFDPKQIHVIPNVIRSAGNIVSYDLDINLDYGKITELVNKEVLTIF